MSEMVRKVGAALKRAWPVDSEGLCCLTPDELDAMARAALAAMREPTEAMVGAGDGCHEYYPFSSSVSSAADAETVWRAMIDAALGGE